MPLLSGRGNTMERLREDLLQRARSERQRDLEQGLPQTQEVVVDEPARFNTTRQSYEPPRTEGTAPPAQATGALQGDQSPQVDTIESPKSPNFHPPPNGSPFNRLSLAAFSRILPRRLQRRDSQTENNASADATRQSSSGLESEGPLPPEPVTHARSTLRVTSSYYSTEESAVEPTAPSSEESRSQRRHRRKKQRRQRDRQARRQPTRFLGCLPWIQSKRMRLHAVRCFVSGLFLCILLTIYLALSVTNQVDIGDITIVLILIVILATLFFAYSLIKLFFLAIRKDRDRNNRMINPWDGTSNDYAVPSQPIRVVLARDEEVAGVESDASKNTPPAYGVWRQSVRVDPDRLFWQRNEQAAAQAREERPQTSASHRPPSYSSDDGVSYVVDAVPRSVAPSSSPSLPTYPSEIGRVSGFYPSR